MLPIEPVEGGGRGGAIAARELGLAEVEESGGRLARAGPRGLLERGHRRLPAVARAARSSAAFGSAVQATALAGSVPAARYERAGVVPLAERLLRPRRGRGARGRAGGSARRPAWVRWAIASAGRPASTRRRPARRWPRPDDGVPGNWRDTAARAVGAAAPSRCAASRRAASAESRGSAWRRHGEAPPAPGAARRTRRPRLAIKTCASPYIGPRALGSPPARMRTSSSWK